MRRVAPPWLPVLAAPLLASCVFLLDYDELQKGAPRASSGGGAGDGSRAGANDSGGAGAVTVAGAGGADGGSSSCGDCDDDDACTIDACDETGPVPECLHEQTVGLKLDGFDVALPSEHHARVAVVASGNRFYLSTLQSDEATPRVSLYRLGSDGSELEQIGTDLTLEGVPMSNIGLAVEELALGDVALHGFVAAKVGDLPARVFHLVNRADETTTDLVGTSYLEGNETVFPQALNIGGSIVGAWIQPDGTIALHDLGTARTAVFGATSLPARTLSLLSTAEDKPAVLFTAQAPAGKAIGTYVETAGQNRARLAECETRPGDYLSSSVIWTQIPGVWMANVTRYGEGYLTSGSGAVACANGSCTPLPEDCAKATPSNGVRNVSGAALHFPTDEAGIVYSVLAVPQVALNEDDPTTAEGRLSLALGRVDFSVPGKAQSTSIGGDPTSGLLRIAHRDTSEAEGFAGPDWPAVGILPSEQVLVAWIQPSDDGALTDLHVQRYKMCLPEP